jgi:nicotinamidase-related amidase
VSTDRNHTIDRDERHRQALLIVDMINTLDFDGGAQLLPAALEAAGRIAALKHAARANGVPVIYANDNFGRWRSDFRGVVRHCLQPGVRGRPLAERLQPGAEDYFVLKPRHSAFYATPLEVLLRQLGTRELLVTGVAADNCVLFTAYDAHLREFRVGVPEDCVAAETPARCERALTQMRQSLDADTARADEVIARFEPGRRDAA